MATVYKQPLMGRSKEQVERRISENDRPTRRAGESVQEAVLVLRMDAAQHARAQAEIVGSKSLGLLMMIEGRTASLL
jgi:hypothetical protein